MRSTTLAYGLLLGAALAGLSHAQGNPPNQGDRTASPVPGGGQAQGIFITAQKPGEWRGAKLVGLTVYSPDNKNLGDVNDILVDDSGMISAVVIGVGGFLGMGEKNVAVPFSSIDWHDRATSTTATAPHSGNASGTPAGAGHGNQGRISADDMVMKGGIPNHPVLNVTKADLQNAPSFAYAGHSLAPSQTQGANAPNTSSNRLPPPTQTTPSPNR